MHRDMGPRRPWPESSAAVSSAAAPPRVLCGGPGDFALWLPGKLYGRGSTDDKGPVAGWLNALEAFQKTNQVCAHTHWPPLRPSAQGTEIEG